MYPLFIIKNCYILPKDAHELESVIVRGFYHAKVKRLACEVYKRSRCFHSPLSLPAFVEV